MRVQNATILYLFLAMLLTAGLQPAEVAAGETDSERFDNADCLDCHGDEDLEADTLRGEDLDLHVDERVLSSSIHDELLCTDCHRGAIDFEDSPHNEGEALELNCSGSGCHDDQVLEYAESIHGQEFAKGDEEVASCPDCHGRHDILASSDRRSRTNKFSLHKTCAVCHESQLILETHPIDQETAVPDFIDSIHGRALLVDGLVVAPSCNDCHGVHDILPHDDPDSRISSGRVPDTCGKCHVLVEDIFNASVHAQITETDDVSSPVCNTCHTSHQVLAPSSAEFRLHADQMCGECHEEQLKGYRDTFHGKAMALGRQDVAACYDCHGHHDIAETDSADSRISEGNRLETCQQCHESANTNFTQYVVHADRSNKEAYPLLYRAFWAMTAVMIGSMLFFALHTILWLYRSTVLYLSDAREWREEKAQARKDTELFTRFSPLDRFLHGLVIVSFLLLIATGMPLKFFYTDWAKTWLDMMGGQTVAAVLHRLGALVTIFYLIVHVGSILYGFISGWSHMAHPETGKVEPARIRKVVFGPDSPIPNMQDFRDFIAHNKWFFGTGPKPQFDRWTYWEKIDYIAIFLGISMITASGLAMWLPEIFTLVFPGWAINVAHIVHSDVALLAAGFIFTFHFFNVHFRPDKFPMDPVMFTGRVSKKALLSERGRQYERWVAEGKVEEHRAGHEWGSWKKIALPAGFIAFLIGLALMILIYYAMVSRLIGK